MIVFNPFVSLFPNYDSHNYLKIHNIDNDLLQLDDFAWYLHMLLKNTDGVFTMGYIEIVFT